MRATASWSRKLACGRFSDVALAHRAARDSHHEGTDDRQVPPRDARRCMRRRKRRRSCGWPTVRIAARLSTSTPMTIARGCCPPSLDSVAKVAEILLRAGMKATGGHLPCAPTTGHIYEPS
jgi:hypothetical protein